MTSIDAIFFYFKIAQNRHFQNNQYNIIPHYINDIIDYHLTLAHVE